MGSAIPQLEVVLVLSVQIAHLDRLTAVRVDLVVVLVLITVLALVPVIKEDTVQLKDTTGHLKGEAILAAAGAAQVLRQRIKTAQTAHHRPILVLQ